MDQMFSVSVLAVLKVDQNFTSFQVFGKRATCA